MLKNLVKCLCAFPFISYLTKFKVALLLLLTVIKPALAGTVNLTLIDHHSQQVLSQTQVTAYQLDDEGNKSWYHRATTDDKGQAIFDLADVENSQRYIFAVKAYNSHYSYSPVITTTSNFQFSIGKLRVTLKDGNQSSKPLLSHHKVSIRKQNAEGKFSYFSSAITDENGLLRLDLPNLGTGDVYQLNAKTTQTQDNKYSEFISTANDVEFMLGNLPVELTLINDEDKSTFASTSVTIYERLNDGSSKWRSRKTTDSNGKALFDLDGLAQGRKYFAKAKVFNNSYSISPLILSPGQQNFIIGNTRFTLFDGTKAEQTPLINHRVDVYKVKANNAKQYFTGATTNDAGRLYLTLPAFVEGETYILKAKSTVSEQYKYSDKISDYGEHSFTVGNKPLSVALHDGITQALIANQRVDVYQIQPEGHLKWYTRGETDETGNVVFDLSGLGVDTQYQLKTKFFNDVYFYSTPIAQTGEFSFALGNTEITLKNGSDENKNVLPEYDTYLYQKLANGNVKSRGKYTSDQLGNIRLNLPTLTANESFYLKARSAYGTSYEYPLIKQGSHDFVIGAAPLSVSLVDAIKGTSIANQSIYVYSLDNEGKKTKFTQVTTDSEGKVSIDLPNISADNPFILSSRVFSNFTSYSTTITNSGEYIFSVGSISVSLTDGSKETPEILPETDISIYKVVDEKRHWHARVKSDANGIARFDLTDFDSGQTYQLAAKSTVDGSYKYSDFITRKGEYNFIVGNPSVNVRVANYLTNEIYPDVDVSAYRIDEEGKSHWYSRRKTDSNGIVSFDLEKISQGQEYKFSTRLFTSGYSYSDVVNKPSNVDFFIGALPVSLIDTESASLLVGKKITLYQINDNNKLHWRRSGTTDENGQVVFDVDGINNNNRFVFKVDNPFGQSKRYYGPIVTSPGAVNFRIKQGEGQQLDLISPEILITTPDSDSALYTGFNVAGHANDNESVDRIEIDVSVNGQSLFLQQAQLQNDGSWNLKVNGDWLQDGLPIVLTATAYDFALNKAVHQISLTLGPDSTPPEITILSHYNNDNVNQTGFTLFGTVSDDDAVQKLTVNLLDPVLGQTISDQNVSIAADGSWSLPVTTNQISNGQSVTITVEAVDHTENKSEQVLALNTVEVTENPIQMANRITFGITPLMLSQINSGTDILNQQIFDQNIDDSELDAELANFSPQDIGELQAYVMYRMIKSKKQLREMMTWFWENHFNTNFNSHDNVEFELSENNTFRELALGRFEDLLLASAKSPAMVYYLNSAQNVVGAANENYAREIMELHSLSVDGGYTDNDIAELAKIFTGWQEENGAFYFNESVHDFTDKTFLGQLITGSGVTEGEQAIAILANHPSTAEYICSKLIVFFVSENRHDLLQNECSTSFLNTNGEIATVLQTIFESESFALEQVTRRKVKTPLELVVSTARTFGDTINIDNIGDSMSRLGMRLFVYPVPTGYSEEGADWLNTNALLQRVQFVNRVIWQNANGIYVDGLSLLQSQNKQTPEAVISYFVDLAYAGEVTSDEYNTFLNILTEEGDFDINGNDADTKIKRLLGTMLSGPAYQMQ